MIRYAWKSIGLKLRLQKMEWTRIAMYLETTRSLEFSFEFSEFREYAIFVDGHIRSGRCATSRANFACLNPRRLIKTICFGTEV